MSDAGQIDELCRHATRLVEATNGRPKSIRLRAGELSVEIEWAEPAGAVAAGPPGGDTTTPPDPDGAGTFTITAPLIGTFYSAPEPGARPFVDVGDMVEEGQQVAIVEAMKLMNAVQAARRGRIVEVLAVNGAPVEYGAPLFVLENA